MLKSFCWQSCGGRDDVRMLLPRHGPTRGHQSEPRPLQRAWKVNAGLSSVQNARSTFLTPLSSSGSCANPPCYRIKDIVFASSTMTQSSTGSAGVLLRGGLQGQGAQVARRGAIDARHGHALRQRPRAPRLQVRPIQAPSASCTCMHERAPSTKKSAACVRVRPLLTPGECMPFTINFFGRGLHVRARVI